VALVIMLTILVRHGYALQNVITAYHLNAMAKVMLTGSVMLGYAYLWEGWGPIYVNNIADRTALLATVLGPYAPTYWARVTLNIFIPQLLWLPRVRRSEILLFLISIGIIVGMWLERYDIVVPNLAHNWIPSYWGVYYPTLWDWATFAGSIGLFLTIFFVLLRVLPIVSIAELRETVAKVRPQ
jgi:molybdopterin-containing oxidoreductase family membrane subunit